MLHRSRFGLISNLIVSEICPIHSFPVESPEHGHDRNARSPHSALKGPFGQPQADVAQPTEPGIRSAVTRVFRLKGVEISAQGKIAERSPPWVRPPPPAFFA